jgi:hypothetical protein
VSCFKNLTLPLSHILEIVTPVWVPVIAPSPEPLFGSFGACLSASSVGFLASYTPRNGNLTLHSEDSILSLDFSPGEPQPDLLSLSIIASEPLATQAWALHGTRSNTWNPPNQRLVKSLVAQPEGVIPNRNSSILKAEYFRVGARGRHSSRRFIDINVMNPGGRALVLSSEDKGKPRIPSEEGRLGNDRNPLERSGKTISGPNLGDSFLYDEKEGDFNENRSTLL